MLELFDTHFHYYGECSPKEYYATILSDASLPPQRDVLLPERFGLMAAGADYLESCRAREFAQVIENARFSVGVHPHSAEKFLAEKNDFTVFRNHPKLRAIGELGLDYYYEHSARKEQREVFEFFLKLALEWRLPAIVHLRDRDDSSDAYAEGYDILRDFTSSGGRFEVHCFSGTPEWAEKFLELGAFLGVTGMVTFPRAVNIRETLKHIPDGRLLIETDAPYLAPVPHRGKTNHPGFLSLVAGAIARERGVEAADIATLTSANARRFFNWEGA